MLNKFGKNLVVTLLLLTPALVTANERPAVLKALKTFYIGDHNGDKQARIDSMHEKGAYRYIDKKGNYQEYQFKLNEGNADKSYREEILSIDIYDKVALAKVRLEFLDSDKVEYKLITLHKSLRGWLVTGISWGFSNNLL